MRDLQEIEQACRKDIFDILEVHGFGHTGGSLSILQMLIALYFDVARVDPENPRWPDRDRIVLSKGHACEAMYAVLAEKGFFPKEKLKEYLEFGSMLQGHTEILTPGVEYSAGSLGQGLSFACGMAYVARWRKKDYKIFCLMGDGECHEGSVWEAAMFAPHYGLDNLTAMVDFNHYTDHGDVDTLMNLQPFEEKWRQFGWETTLVDQGNSVQKIVEALNGFRQSGRPKCLIANTVKNFGVPFWKHLHQVSGEILYDGVREGRKALHV